MAHATIMGKGIPAEKKTEQISTHSHYFKNQRHCTNSIIDTIKELCDKSSAMINLQCIFNEENPRLVFSIIIRPWFGGEPDQIAVLISVIIKY